MATTFVQKVLSLSCELGLHQHCSVRIVACRCICHDPRPPRSK
jgi:hypothetical protein